MQWIPMTRLHRLQSVVDTMHRRATEIYREKKARLDKGDETFLQQVGEGKDLMSILREFFAQHIHTWNTFSVLT